MDILIKPNSLNLDKYIDKIKGGNVSFLFGLKDYSIYDNSISYLELTKIVNKYKNNKIYVSLDKNFFNKDIPNLIDLLKELDSLPISGIFFYDLSILNIKEENNLKKDLIWNQNFLVTNYRTCNYYYDLGVKSCVASSEITLDEIIEIKKNTKMNMFVNIFGYQLMSHSKRSLISNYFKYINEKDTKKDHHLLKEGKSYIIKENNIGTSIYSNNILNGLTKINELKTNNINIILNEMNIEENTFLEVLEIYDKAINNNLTEEELTKLDKKIKDKIPNTGLGFLETKTIYKMK